MKRRAFLRSAAGASAAAGFFAANPLIAGAGQTGEIFATDGWRADPQPRNPVHVLGPTPPTPHLAFVKRLTDDVFERLRLRFAGRSLKLTTGNRTGKDGITDQWCNGIKMGLWQYSLEDGFDLELFRRHTNGLCNGPAVMLACEHFPEKEAARFTRVGMPVLPESVMWAVHYLDEDSGLLMRVIADYQFFDDDTLVRWDVLCG